uniref:Beta-1,4-galactosyltransferase 1 n=1 Tax=Strix occidentalis caurina TaxID=311401 RepID=A0A8D0FRT6_STROC
MCQWEHTSWVATQIGGFSRLISCQPLSWGLIPRGYSVCGFVLNGVVQLLWVWLIQASTASCTSGILFGSKHFFLKNKTKIGALRVEFSQPVNLEEVARINPEVKAGGRFAPKDCIALQKVAIIIPFRNREEHLKYWLYYLHPILQRQQLDYGVYVINQDGEEEFNRAKLLNIGFAEALKEYDYDCFVFSDVDLIPMDDRNTYKCYSQPRHLSVSMDKFGFRLPYNQYFGGVSALSKEQFTKINGFPNNYWGWGGEDDDIYNSSDLGTLFSVSKWQNHSAWSFLYTFLSLFFFLKLLVHS